MRNNPMNNYGHTFTKLTRADRISLELIWDVVYHQCTECSIIVYSSNVSHAWTNNADEYYISAICKDHKQFREIVPLNITCKERIIRDILQ